MKIVLSYFTWWMSLTIALGLGLVTAVFVWFIVVPRQRNKIIAQLDGKFFY